MNENERKNRFIILPDEEVLRQIEIEEQEKMWFHCVKNLNWNTFDTVCLKKYRGDSTAK